MRCHQIQTISKPVHAIVNVAKVPHQANEAKDAMIVDHVGIPQFVFSMNIQEKVVPLDQSNWMSDFGTI